MSKNTLLRVYKISTEKLFKLDNFDSSSAKKNYSLNFLIDPDPQEINK